MTLNRKEYDHLRYVREKAHVLFQKLREAKDILRINPQQIQFHQEAARRLSQQSDVASRFLAQGGGELRKLEEEIRKLEDLDRRHDDFMRQP